jgi:hypothetical protein
VAVGSACEKAKRAHVRSKEKTRIGRFNRLSPLSGLWEHFPSVTASFAALRTAFIPGPRFTVDPCLMDATQENYEKQHLARMLPADAMLIEE